MQWKFLLQITICIFVIIIIAYFYLNQNKNKKTYLTIGSQNLKGVTFGLNTNFTNDQMDMVISIQELWVPNTMIPANTKAGDWFRVNLDEKTRQSRINYFVLGLPGTTNGFVFGLSFNPNCGLNIDESAIKAFVSKQGREVKGVLLVKVKSRLEKRSLYIGGLHGHWNGSFENAENVSLVKQAINHAKNTPCILLGDFNMKKQWAKTQFKGNIFPKNETVTFYDYTDIDYAIYNNITCVNEGMFVSKSSDHFCLTQQKPNYSTETKVINVIKIV